jgi:hypothetical protein
LGVDPEPEDEDLLPESVDVELDELSAAGLVVESPDVFDSLASLDVLSAESLEDLDEDSDPLLSGFRA